jgi:hypothetical protein
VVDSANPWVHEASDDEPAQVQGLRAAVVRAFNELRRLGEGEKAAFTAALRVFTFHEPTIPVCSASKIVRCWMGDETSGEMPRISLSFEARDH